VAMLHAHGDQPLLSANAVLRCSNLFDVFCVRYLIKFVLCIQMLHFQIPRIIFLEK